MGKDQPGNRLYVDEQKCNQDSFHNIVRRLATIFQTTKTSIIYRFSDEIRTDLKDSKIFMICEFEFAMIFITLIAIFILLVSWGYKKRCELLKHYSTSNVHYFTLSFIFLILLMNKKKEIT